MAEDTKMDPEAWKNFQKGFRDATNFEEDEEKPKKKKASEQLADKPSLFSKAKKALGY